MSAMFKALENPNYRVWAGGALVSNIGTWMQRVAQDWLVLTILTDHSGTAVGITTALQFLPMLLFGPYAGVLADRYRKRVILLWTQAAMGICGLIVGLLVVTGVAELWHVYIAAAALGLAAAMDAPARQAFVSELVGPEKLSNAVALNSASFNSARLTGPAIAGVLIAWIGTGPVFILNAASFVAVIISLLRVKVSQLEPATPVARGKHQFLDGLQYVRQRPDLTLIMVMVGLLGAFGMNFPVTNSLMATAEFGMGPEEFGALGSIMAIGTLAGALLAARRSGPRLRFLLGGALSLGIFTLAASVAPSFWVYAVVLIPVGLASITFLNSCNTTIQLSVEPQFRGRVLALYLAILQGGTAIGAPLMGWIGTEFGARWSVAAGGAVVLVTGVACVILVSRRSEKTLRQHVRNVWTRRRPAEAS
ncbi:MULTISPECIES: MFS transporter [Paenarthrobacter]|uniref:MFS transporter n=1 Tax=Paenarthrobacter TaxID=1742992 RepID=UPI00074D367F|nr:MULTISPECIES: MFS transporter [Paenarthrobacter]AMB39231.1 MFS transporter [Arthrobacter sp. ATCC 21022]KUR64920.1 MFS transporter [Arthrobacter sp. ATCC 21022]QSZ51702.1 MFS transporter [Paenarthrobacter ureafaciens]RWW95454.1 MFS transporter [Paenarthrobacter ureafaciens]WOC61598.1 MFS transporter [Paenarthrobacter sp. AT5]